MLTLLWPRMVVIETSTENKDTGKQASHLIKPPSVPHPSSSGLCPIPTLPPTNKLQGNKHPSFPPTEREITTETPPITSPPRCCASHTNALPSLPSFLTRIFPRETLGSCRVTIQNTTSKTTYPHPSPLTFNPSSGFPSPSFCQKPAHGAGSTEELGTDVEKERPKTLYRMTQTRAKRTSWQVHPQDDPEPGHEGRGKGKEETNPVCGTALGKARVWLKLFVLGRIVAFVSQSLV